VEHRLGGRQHVFGDRLGTFLCRRGFIRGCAKIERQRGDFGRRRRPVRIAVTNRCGVGRRAGIVAIGGRRRDCNRRRQRPDRDWRNADGSLRLAISFALGFLAPSFLALARGFLRIGCRAAQPFDRRARQIIGVAPFFRR
jgi:hypothetical protein